MTTWKEVCGQKLHYATIENISSVCATGLHNITMFTFP
ncbi:unnamed protein product [Porites evermanni]|uniref:Uncharacterized protein n=1 Tax=Porites evermanni TaxID=104178 RepID=A0ABN8SP07_9CNID|nr:unnamed protein product [Porites evermanni]